MRQAFRRHPDLAATALIAVLALLATVISAPEVIRVPLGIGLVAVAPGYALAAVLFPRWIVEASTTERVALAVGLSLAMIPLLGLVLAAVSAPLTATTFLVTIGGLVIVLVRLAARKRNGVTAGPGRSLREASTDERAWRASAPASRALTVGALAAAVLATVAATYVLTSHRSEAPYTEFYMLGVDGTTATYPTRLHAGDNATILLGIANHEHETISYGAQGFLEVGGAANESDRSAWEPRHRTAIPPWNVTLEAGATGQHTVTFQPAAPGLHRLAFTLHAPERPDPYRSLHLWIEVDE